MATASSSRAEDTLSTPRQPLPASRSRTGASSPARPPFPAQQLRPFVQTLLSRNLTGVSWNSQDKARARAASKEISERVKQKMLEIEPRGFKYIVTVTMSENLGQAGRADMSCHWEESDTVIQEMWSNDSIIFVCLAFAVRII